MVLREAREQLGAALEPVDLLLLNAYVVTVDRNRQIFADGAVAIRGSRIVAVGRTDRLSAAYAATQVIDARNCLVMPGLIDGHHHPNQYLSNGIGDDVDIMTLLYRRLYPYEAALTVEQAYLSALGSFAEALRYGTTCFNDPGGVNSDAMAQAAVDIGIRGLMCRSTRDTFDQETPVPDVLREDTATNLRRTEEFIQRWHNAGDGRLRAWTGLRYVYNVSEELCHGIKAIADKYGVGIHAHAAAVAGENEAMYDRVGRRSLERFHDLGLFDRNLYLVHMGYPNQAEVQLLARHGCKVIHCPTASMLGAYGVIQNGMMPKMADAGVCIGLGSDSATAGGTLDMVRVMYAGACAHKDRYTDATLWGAYKAVEMATIDCARACLWDDEIGSLEAGKKADLIVVPMEGLTWHPGRDPVPAFVYSNTGNSVDTVIVDGRILMRGRRLVTVDETSVAGALAEASKDWRRRTGVEFRPPWPVN